MAIGELEGSSLFYRLVRLVGSPLRYRVLGMENVRDHGPALLVANHIGSAGPLAGITSMPLRLYPWVIAEMTGYRRTCDLLKQQVAELYLAQQARSHATHS